MNCPACSGSGFIETEYWIKEVVGGSNGSTTYKMTPVVERCPDCGLWEAILPFLRVAVLIPDDKAPDDFHIIDFFTKDSPDSAAASLSVKDFRRLKEFIQIIADGKHPGNEESRT